MRRKTCTMIAILAANASGAGAQSPETGFLDRTTTVEGLTYPYQVYVPRDYDPARQWPVILFLHGAGERGSDGLLQTEVGLPSAIRRRPDRYPAIIVMRRRPPIRHGRGSRVRPRCRRSMRQWPRSAPTPHAST